MKNNFIFGAMPESTSPAGSLNLLDFKKASRALVVAVVGAGLTAALDFASQWLLGADLGQYRVIVFPIATWLLELGRRYVSDHFVVVDN